MFRTLARRLGINRLDWLLWKMARRKGRSVLLGWNRGLGDIPLGLYAVVHRIRSVIPDAKITFVTRSNLVDGFSMLEGVDVIEAADWKRGETYDLSRFQLDYDLVIERPSPSDWCTWQRGSLVPRLRWDRKHDLLHEKFSLPRGFIYIGVQVSAETNYGQWRNWPIERWRELFDRLEKRGNVRVLLFGFGTEPQFDHPHLIDLRGKTTLFELLSIIKMRCHGVVLPDSGISSMLYYLDETFSLCHVTLWADPNHGLLKQNVPPPNRRLVHRPLIGEKRDLSTVSAKQVEEALFPKKKKAPLTRCIRYAQLGEGNEIENAAALILAGGQGTRLGFAGPKGLFPLLGKTLFQRLCEKIPESMPIAIMTSPLNHEETVAYFERLGRKVLFFSQSMLPLLDRQYREIELAPDGNGCVFEKLVSSTILNQLEESGIDTISIVPVDNPLANPADARLITHHRQRKNDITIKCIERRSGESMGVLVEENGAIRVAEYLDLTAEELESSLFRYGYTGQIVVSTSFIRRAAQENLPFHWVKKQGLWKRERFIFDAFRAAHSIEAVCYPRDSCYAPIKGAESIGMAEEALSAKGLV